MGTKRPEETELQILKVVVVGSDPSSEASDDEESVSPGSLGPGGTLRQYRESCPSRSQRNEPIQGERIDERTDHTGDTDNGLQIFEVVALGDHQALSDLLNSHTTSIDAMDKEGNTALHRAVASACQQRDSEECFYKCIDRLMNCEQMKVNMPNKKGYTAIGLAVHRRYRTCIEHMLKHPLAERLHLDCYPGDSESTVREILMETYPDLERLLQPPIMQSLDSPDRDMKLIASLHYEKDKIFSETLSETNPNPQYDEPYHSSLLEIACQTKNRERFVEMLLKRGADPNIKNRVTGMPLIHATARSGNLDVLKILLKQHEIDKDIKDNKGRTILHWLARISEKIPGDEEKIESCLKFVLNSCGNTSRIIDWKDYEENTALYVAVKSGFKDRVMFFLKRGADIMLCIHDTSILSSVSTPMLEDILDDCFECNDEPENSKYLKLTINYEILHKIIPHLAECPLQQKLLKHPVALWFINIHSINIKTCIHIQIFVYMLWLSLTTSEILFFGEQYGSLLLAAFETIAFSFFLLFSCGSNIRYFRTWENFLSLPLLIHTFLSTNDDYRNYWTWPHILVICFLLAWLKLVLMTGRFWWGGVQLEMFKRVSCTFLRYLAGYFFVLITLALTIFITFRKISKQYENFAISDLFHSILKTIVMFAGEFNFSYIPFEILPGTSHVIFLLFVFLGPIILLNLLNGLAVFDTQELIRDAETLNAVATVRKIKFTNNLNEFFMHNLFKNGEFSVYPNRTNPSHYSLLNGIVAEPYFSLCIRRKREKSKKPQSIEKKLKTMEKKFDQGFKEIQDTLNKILTRLDTEPHLNTENDSL